MASVIGRIGSSHLVIAAAPPSASPAAPPLGGGVAIAGIAAFVIYAEYVVWIKSPIAQVTAICDNLRALKEVNARNVEPLRLIDEASAATLEPLHLITQAVRAATGKPSTSRTPASASSG